MTSNLKRLASKVDKEQFLSLHEEMSFSDYIERVNENPLLARTAYQRIYDMIMSKGFHEFEKNRKTLTHYNFFDDEAIPIFGLDETLDNLVKFIRGAAGGYGTEKRVLLLHGPVGSSKSTIARRLKRGLEEYTRTPEGALFTFKWVDLPTGDDGIYMQSTDMCPMREDPLKLIALADRQKFIAELNEKRRDVMPEDKRNTMYSLRCDGDLCPRCKKFMEELMIRNEGDWETVVTKHIRVVRMVMSESNRVGIATFQPKDEKNQDATELTGDINFAKLPHYGSDSDPRCVAGDTLVATDKGLCKISSFLPKDNLEADVFYANNMKVSSFGDTKFSDSVYYGGKKMVFNIVTKLGYSISATANHKLMTVGLDGKLEWKRVSDLNSGDYVALSRGSNVWSDVDYKFSEYNPELYGNEQHFPKYPDKMSQELGYLFGLWIGDGHFWIDKNHHEVGWTQVENERRKTFNDLVEKLFSIRMNECKTEGHSAQLRISSKLFYGWLTEIAGLKGGASNKEIPDCVLQSSKQVVVACLQGLWETDGNIRSNHGSNTANFVTCSSKLAKQVHTVLLGLGVVSSLYAVGNYWEVRVYGKNVNKLVELMPTLKDRYTSGSEDHVKSLPNVDVLPNIKPLMRDLYLHALNRHDMKKQFSGNLHDVNKKNISYETLHDFLECIKINENDEDCFNDLKKLADKNYVWLPIQSISEVGIVDVYDLSVGDTHAYCGNNFVIHNCFNFDGEFCVANRGMVEFIEMLKLAQEFLYDLLGASQERQIKPKKFAQVSVDEMILGHSVHGDTPIPHEYNGVLDVLPISKMSNLDVSKLRVFSVNEETRQVELTEVKSIFSHNFEGEWIRNEQDDDYITTTPNHSVYNKNYETFYPGDDETSEILTVEIPDYLIDNKPTSKRWIGFFSNKTEYAY